MSRIAIATAIVLLVLAFLWLDGCQRVRQATTRADLGEAQTNAAIASGTDAVSTLGNRQATDAAGDQTVQETRDAINNATDADGAAAAGRNGLCGLASYRGKPECM